ncbi:MAG: sensor histidine kinase [Bacteroidales bacterium]|nr:sensor histidine kinase [Bacteroidales bacterium]
MKNFKAFILILIIQFLQLPVSSQNNETDSLKTLLNTDLRDTAFVNTALDLAWAFMYSETDSAVKYANIALQAAKANKLQLKAASAYNTLGVCYIVKADYYEALSNLSLALETGKALLEKEPGNKTFKRRVLAIYTNTGNIYYYKGEYEKSITNYLHALDLAEDIGFENGIAVNLSNVAASYKDLLNYPKALEYNYKALAIAQRTGDRFSLSQSLNNLGSVYFSTKDYDSAYSYFVKSKRINEEDGEEYELINNYVNLADVFRETQQYDSSLYYYKRSIAICEKVNSIDGLINCNYMIGQLYQKQGLLDKAAEHYDESLRLAKESGTSRFVMLANEDLAKVYQKKGDYKRAFAYFTAGSAVRDSIFNAESDARIADMEAKYKTEKKEEEIAHLREQTKLQNEKSRFNRFVFLSVIIILVLVIALIIISYRSFRQRQISDKRKAQQQAELQVLDAVIETEFKERKRFAEDLHDGLGVLLSTLRLYLNEIDDSSGEEQKKLIGQSNNILDEAIANARNISNNMMPAALKKNGLEAAIRSFSDKINSSGNIKIEVQSANFKKHHKHSVEITLYRILTEMTNNTLKHAAATRIDISLTGKGNKLFIVYKDNGRGFDFDAVSKSGKKGMGLNNMRSRINSIGGECTIKSKPGTGFFAGIEVDFT